ncbi:ribosomal protein L1p/L10e family-domain-containing protein [Crassisporium funariophilum]|nr:ribosomal protein L1p/L10e family-domain-containing protein [Crassisporium funariophilum]
MSEEDFIDSHVSVKQCRKAVEALHSHELKKKEKFEENQLLPGKEQNVWLNVTVKQIAANHKFKPTKIPIVHPLVDPRTTPVCLITKDPQRQYKDLLETHKIKFISRVVGIEKLKGKFKPYEARRMLLKENGLFLADERVVPLLPKLLGSKWFEAKKQPIPVCLTRKDLKGELERAISSTYMNQNQGTCISIKVGKLSHTTSQILDNIKTALPAIANAVKGNWDNIQSLNIKTNSSVSLPIWSCTLDDVEGGRWSGLHAEDEEEDVEVNGSDLEGAEKAVEAVEDKKASAGKGRKRPSSSDEEEEEAEKPKKKVKGAEGATTKEKSAKSNKPTSNSTEAAPQSKKRKSADPAPVSAVPITPAETSNLTVKKGKKSKAPTAVAAEVLEPVPEPAEGKKKQKTPKTLPVSALQPSSPAVIAAPLKQKKVNKSDPAPSVVDAPAPKKSTPASNSVIASSPKIPSGGKEKKKVTQSPNAVVSAPSPEKSAKASITKKEMQQKRGEKKKDIILKAKGGKSAKNAVLGKKVAQE